MHGADFIPTALAQGAAAILTDAAGRPAWRRMRSPTSDVPLVVAEDARAALAWAAALWFGAQPETMVAVTGTNGKTSVATFTRQIWTALGHAAINIGTTGVEGAWDAPSAHTTPEPITLHRLLAEAAAAGVTHAAMEASSHGLDQRRLDGVRLQGGGLHQLHAGPPRLSRHVRGLFRGQGGLFARVLPEDGVAVINMNDPRGQDMACIATARGQRLLRVGHGAEARPAHPRAAVRRHGAGCALLWQGQPHQVRLDLIGGFQAENVALAAGLAIAAGDERPRRSSPRCRSSPACAGGCSLPRPGATGRRSMSTTRIRPTPSRRRCRRCARM